MCQPEYSLPLTTVIGSGKDIIHPGPEDMGFLWHHQEKPHPAPGAAELKECKSRGSSSQFCSHTKRVHVQTSIETSNSEKRLLMTVVKYLTQGMPEHLFLKLPSSVKRRK